MAIKPQNKAAFLYCNSSITCGFVVVVMAVEDGRSVVVSGPFNLASMFFMSTTLLGGYSMTTSTKLRLKND